MFSLDKRCIYKNNQLAEVICQLRFPEILAISAHLPVDFQEAIRSDYPQYSARKEAAAPQIVGTPGHLNLENQPTTINYQFTSADGIWQINLTSTFIALACKQYVCWEEFAKKLDNLLAVFIKIYNPAYFARIGLRYVNFISKKNLDVVDLPFCKLIQPMYLGVLADHEVDESNATRSSVDAEFAIRGGCRAKILAGLGRVQKNGIDDGEVKFIFDQDLYMKGNIPVNYSAGALQTLHSQAFPIFRHAISDRLHEALEPTPI